VKVLLVSVKEGWQACPVRQPQQYPPHSELRSNNVPTPDDPDAVMTTGLHPKWSEERNASL